MTNEQFIELVESLTPDENGCLLWPRAIDPTGYGAAVIDGRKRGAHRVALEWRLGRPIHRGLLACHACDVRHCVNPDHVWEGTHADNMADMLAKDRQSTCGPTYPRVGGSVKFASQPGRVKRWRVQLRIGQTYISKGIYQTKEEALSVLAAEQAAVA